MAFLITMTGRSKGDYYELSNDTNVIGRLEALPIHVLDVAVSRRHMEISFNNDLRAYFAKDMGSRHGVFINGIKINQDRKLTEGDRITLGQTDLLFTLEKITDHNSALSRLMRIEQEFPTLEISVNSTRDFYNSAMNKSKSLLQNFVQWAGSQKATLAIVFTDIIGSTALVQCLGNECMDQIRRAHFVRARNLIQYFNGFEIKTNGDEFMIAFHTAVNALDFATELHKDTGDKRISIRAAIHIGPVIIEEEDVQGVAVNYAARVIDMAINGDVWLSDEVKNHINQEKADRHKELCWQEHPNCMLKGFSETHLLWSVKKNI